MDETIRQTFNTLAKSRLVIITTYLMLFSYFYNLPVLTYSAKGSNELRMYDLAGIALFFLYFKHFGLINALIRYSRTLIPLYYFLIYASISLLFTIGSSILHNKIFWAFQSILYLYHFWIFFLNAVFLIIIIQDMKQLKRIVTVSLVMASIVFLIVLLQNLGLIPFLWNKSYAGNYHSFLSGTLGPNKIVLGMTSLMVFALCMGLLNDKRVKINTPLLLVTIALSAVVLVMSGSRTSYVGMAVFMIYFFLRETKSFLFSGGVLFLLLILVSSVNGEIIQRAVEVYQGRVENKIQNPDDIREARIDELYEDLGSGRKGLSIWYLQLLYDNLLNVPLGKGFNNRLETMSSAHNTYLSLVFEVGIVGTILYFRWLAMYLFTRLPHFPQLRMALKGLVLSMLVTLFFGEHLYVYRTLFALVGLFLFITTILASPTYILPDERKRAP